MLTLELDLQKLEVITLKKQYKGEQQIETIYPLPSNSRVQPNGDLTASTVFSTKYYVPEHKVKVFFGFGRTRTVPAQWRTNYFNTYNPIIIKNYRELMHLVMRSF